MNEQLTPPPEITHIPEQVENPDIPQIEQFQIPEVLENVESKGFFRDRLSQLSNAWEAAKNVVSKVGNAVFDPIEHNGKTYGVKDSLKIRFSSIIHAGRKPQPSAFGDRLHHDDPRYMNSFDRAVWSHEQKISERKTRQSRGYDSNSQEELSAGDALKLMSYEAISLLPVRLVGLLAIKSASEIAARHSDESTNLGKISRRINANATARTEVSDKLYTNPVVRKKNGLTGADVRAIRNQRVKELLGK